MSRQVVANAIQQYVEYLKPWLHLEAWQITVLTTCVGDDGDEQDFGMSVLPTEGRKSASMFFSTKLAEEDFDELHYFICHEMVHLMTRDIRLVFEHGIENAGIGSAVVAVLEQSILDQEELLVDHIGMVLAELIPHREHLLDIIKNTEQGD
jgi:hypothetical protein